MGNGDLKLKRAEFFARMRKHYKTSTEEIVRILKRNNYNSFKLSEIPEYEFAVKTHFDILAQKNGKKKEPDNPLGLKKQYFPCPIIGCNGVKVEYYFEGKKRWKCSIGGERHYWAILGAKAEIARSSCDKSVEERATEIVNLLESKNDNKQSVLGS